MSDPDVVRGPELVGEHSDLGRRFYESLRRSGQSAFYEPSDFAWAEIVVVGIDAFVASPTAAMLSALLSSMRGLLVCEPDRRRARIELTRVSRSGLSERDAAISDLAEWRQRLSDDR